MHRFTLHVLTLVVASLRQALQGEAITDPYTTPAAIPNPLEIQPPGPLHRCIQPRPLGRETRRQSMPWIKINTAVLLVIVLSVPASAEIIHGFADIQAQAFDFSAQQVVDYDGYEADLGVIYVQGRDELSVCLLWNSSLVRTVLSTPLDELAEAPADLSTYDCTVLAELDITCVVATWDGVYAKFALRQFDNDGHIIEYYVQTDGTRNFTEPVGIEVTTWSRIKSLYNASGN
jgi:hypothetical protein